MTGFDAMADGDLILCVNLLHADAHDYEQMSNEPEHQAILRERAADRRALAARMLAEVDRRGAERWASFPGGLTSCTQPLQRVALNWTR